MEYRDPIDIGNKIYLIDGFDLGFPSRTGSYLFDEEKLTIIETGPSRSVPQVIKGLKSLGKSLEDVQYIIVTHIHLDHAGGAGLLLKECPNAKVIVHPRGFRHLISPIKLMAGAKAVYREHFEELFAPVLPVPENRLIVMNDHDTLKIGQDRLLTFLDTPGHAKHHFSIYDPYSKGIFTGDTVGIRYDGLHDFGGDVYLPTTSPNQFNPDEMLDSMAKIKELDIDRIYFGHFGMSLAPDEAFSEVAKWLAVFMEEGRRIFSDDKDIFKLADALFERVTTTLSETRQIPMDHDFYKILKLDTQVSAMGIIDYLEKQNKKR